MTIAAGVAGTLQEAGLVVVTALAGVALLRRSSAAGAWAMVGAAALAGALLVGELWDGPQAAALSARPAAAAAAALVGLAALAAGAGVILRRPGILAVAAVAALPFRVPLTVGGTTANLLVPLYAVIGAGVIAHLAAHLRGRRAPPRARPGVLEWALAAFTVLYAVQATYSGDAAQALRNVVFFYVPFALLFALLAGLEWTPALRRACLRVLVGLGVAFSLVGFAQYLAGDVFVNAKLEESNAYNPYFRANSLFFDPNVYGRYLVVVILFVVAALAGSRRARTMTMAGGILALLWCGLLTALSSSSFIALLAGLAVLVALLGHGRVVAAAAGALVVAAAVLVVAFPTTVGLRPDSAGSVRKATSGRNKLITGGAELFAQRPLLGWGSGAFAVEYRRAGYETGRRGVAASHTIPLTVAVEQGLAGLAAYLALLGAAFRLLLRGARTALPRAAVGAAFAALVVHTLLYAAFLEDPLSWALLAAGVAWGAGRRAEPGGTGPRAGQAPDSGSRMSPTLAHPDRIAPVADVS